MIDESQEIPVEVGYRLDLLQSMRDYFAEIYGNEVLFFDVETVKDETLGDWCSRHTRFYNEACRLVNDCVARGHIFDPEKIAKIKDYHLEKAQMLSSVLMIRARKRAKDAGAEAPAT